MNATKMKREEAMVLCVSEKEREEAEEV